MKTKKNKLTNFLKIGILFFGISFLLWNCEKETYLPIHESENSQTFTPTFKIISKEILNKDPNINTKLEVFKTNQKLKTQSKNNDEKYIYSDEYNFYINTNFSVVNTIKNLKTYTFEVERDNQLDNTLENLVIHFDTISKESKQFLLKYPKIYDSYDFENVQIEKINDESLIKTLARGEDCFNVTTYESSYTDYPCWSGEHSGQSEASQCDTSGGGNPPFSIKTFSWVTVEQCSTTDELIYGDSGGGFSGGGVGTGGGSSGGLSGGFDDNVITIPFRSFSFKWETFLNSLTHEQSSFLAHNENVLNRVQSFFEDKEFSIENKEFITQTINLLNGSLSTINFNGSKEYREFINITNNSLHHQNIQIETGIDLNTTLSLNEWNTVSEKLLEIHTIIKNYNIISLNDISQLSLAEQNVVAQNSLFISFLPNLKDLGIELPQTTEEWSEFGEILVEVMYEIIPDLIPGIAELNSLKNSISAFSNGSYTDGTTELVFALIGVFPAGKLMKALAKFTKLAKKATKIFKTYIKLFKLNKPLARGFKKVIKDSNKMNKIFGNAGHKLDNLVAKAGGEKEALIKVSEKIQELKLSDQIPLVQPNGWAGRFDNIDVLGEKLSIQIYKSADGSIINIADMWKP